MAFQVDFYTFEKNTNSTKKPTGASVPFQCELLGETSIVTPNIVLVVGGNPTVYNYAYIGEFKRYYFVQDWEWYRGRWSAKLTVDTLATWKDYIGRSSEYVLRSASRSDGDIVDNLYPIKGGITVQTNSADKIWEASLDNGVYVVGILNDDGESRGGASYYVFRPLGFKKFMEVMLNDSIWNNIEKEYFNPFQYVVSCMWFPFEKGIYGAAVNLIKIGWWEFTVGSPSPGVSICYQIPTSPYYTGQFSIDIPKHPQSSNRGRYMNLSPYTDYLLDVRPWGQFEIDGNKIIDVDKLYCFYNIDLISGQGSLMISNTPSYRDAFSFAETTVGVPVQMSQISRNYFNTITTAATGAMQIPMNNIAGGIVGTISAIGNAVQSSKPNSLTKGSNGSLSGLLYLPNLSATFHDVIEEDKEHRGRPLCKKTKISSLSGYILCADAEIKLPATDIEINIVKKFMNGGFYYE